MYEQQIADIYRICNVRAFPVDPFRIMSKLGFNVKSYSDLITENPELIFLRNNATDALTIVKKRQVLYNDRKPRRRIRFTLMHELGHVIGNTNNEELADRFAAEILAPVCIVRELRLKTAEEISVHFDVSIACANNVIMQVRNDIPSPFESSLINYFREVCQKPSERLYVHQDGKYRRFEANDRKLRMNHTDEEYWNIVLDRLENERLNRDY